MMSGDWRYGIGLWLLAMAGLSIVSGVVGVFVGQAVDGLPGWPIWLLSGAAEIFCLLAAAILGKENYQKLARKARRSSEQAHAIRQTSRLRYYLGLAGCLSNGIPLTLYAYVPEMLPGGSAKASILVVSDLVFVAGLFFAGGEFWEKLRRIFIWEGDLSGSPQ